MSSPPIVVTGNPIDGFRFIGPFEETNKAIAWATDHCTADWVVTQLKTPEQFNADNDN